MIYEFLIDEDEIFSDEIVPWNQAFPFKYLCFLPVLSEACKNARPISVIAICFAIVNSVAEMKLKVLCKTTIHI